MAFGNLVFPAAFLLLATASLISSHCPLDKNFTLGHCAFRIHCTGTVMGAFLPKVCQGSTNFDVTVQLVLTNPEENFEEINQDLLFSVTTLQIIAEWPKTSLTFLKYTPRLKYLNLSGDQINHISAAPFYSLRYLERIDLSHNYLSDIHEVFAFEEEPNKLEILSLAYNVIKEIPGDAFGEMTSLVELDLSYNFIIDLSEEPFFNLTNLKVLRLNSNKIQNLNGALNSLKNLQHLYLKGNNIQHIDDESLQIIYHLRTFDMSDNQLASLTPVVFMRHWNHIDGLSVCKIILSDNHLTFLPNATSTEIERGSRFVRDLKNHTIDVMTDLDLSNNTIKSVGYDAFRTILQLISLDLSHNQLYDFNVNAKDLSHLKYLNLSTNYIQYVYYENFYTMIYLQNLDLSHNQLRFVPDKTFINNHYLKSVNLQNNYIREISSLHLPIFHPDGGILDLSNNELISLFIPLGEGIRLHKLILHTNNISDASLIDLAYHTELKYLELNRNSIQELEQYSLRLPVTTIFLDISENVLTKIKPSSFERLTHLRTLRLCHNRLDKLEYGTFKGLTSLLNLDLSNNDITFLDSSVFTDLKSLRTLSLRYNKMNSLDYKTWLGHKFELTLFMEGNSFSCDWLATALSDYNKGFSKMRPAAKEAWQGSSVEGIPCKPKEVAELVDIGSARPRLVDEMMLVTNQKILEALKEQTNYMKKFLWHSILNQQNKKTTCKECQ